MTTLGAAMQVLAFLGTAAGVFCAFAAAAMLYLLGRQLWAQRAIAVGALGVSAYVVTLLLFGVTSPPRTIAVGQGKAFCEIDCHVVYSVTDARHDSDTLLLTVRELFDAGTISSRRGNAPLHPGGRRFAIVDANGKRWRPVGIRMLDSSPLFTALRPGQDHRAQLRFALPRGTAVRGLLVEDDSPISPLLIGHERSPFHQKIILALPPAVTSARGARAPFAPGHPA